MAWHALLKLLIHTQSTPDHVALHDVIMSAIFCNCDGSQDYEAGKLSIYMTETLHHKLTVIHYYSSYKGRFQLLPQVKSIEYHLNQSSNYIDFNII